MRVLTSPHGQFLERAWILLLYLLGGCVVFLAISSAGCGRPIGDARRETATAPAAAELANQDTIPAGEDSAWRGLERHEIQLDQKLLVVKGSKGVIGCPYLNVGSFEKFGEACAIVPAVDTAGMLNSKVTAVTAKAKELGIEVGMSGREALDKIR
ncbi:MAG TPA: DUF1805 domain-containing protein [Pirellulales bacterium]|jgi:uncharacterized protein YunC (DUF1805 family)|nr:DUF1805 domain-containing protein [Pirellulales bacterium]